MTVLVKGNSATFSVLLARHRKDGSGGVLEAYYAGDCRLVTSVNLTPKVVTSLSGTDGVGGVAGAGGRVPSVASKGAVRY